MNQLTNNQTKSSKKIEVQNALNISHIEITMCTSSFNISILNISTNITHLMYFIHSPHTPSTFLPDEIRMIAALPELHLDIHKFR